MELDEFITESLKGIIKGIKDAQEFAKENGARINPFLVTREQVKHIPAASYTFYGDEDGARLVSTVQFDIAVTTSNEREAGGQGGISILSFNAVGKLLDKNVNEVVSRLQFSVNVALPNVKP